MMNVFHFILTVCEKNLKVFLQKSGTKTVLSHPIICMILSKIFILLVSAL
jgi:hypothetical protein